MHLHYKGMKVADVDYGGGDTGMIHYSLLYWFIYLLIYLFIYLFTYLFTCLLILLLFIYLFIYLFVFSVYSMFVLSFCAHLIDAKCQFSFEVRDQEKNACLLLYCKNANEKREWLKDLKAKIKDYQIQRFVQSNSPLLGTSAKNARLVRYSSDIASFVLLVLLFLLCLFLFYFLFIYLFFCICLLHFANS
jgi:hypothetical protein